MKLQKNTKRKPRFNVIRSFKTFVLFIKLIFKIFLVIFVIVIFTFSVYRYRNFFNIKLIKEKFFNYTAEYGFVVKNIYLEGQNHIDTKLILDSLKIKINDPILSISLEDVVKRINKISWVKTSVVDRQYPNTLYIGIEERVPIAIGQNKENLFLIDMDGKMIKEDHIEEFKDLPIVIGDELENFVFCLYPIIKENIDLYKKIISITRVSNRRWNIKFNNGLEIKLPEDDQLNAWKIIIKLYNNNELFIDSIKSIDLRIKNRIFIEKI